MLRALFLVLVTCFVSSAFAETSRVPDTNQLTVGIAECPPFVIAEDGRYRGLGIYLWEQAAQELGYSFDYVEYPLGSLLEIIRSYDPSAIPDVGISCTSVTAEREELAQLRREVKRLRMEREILKKATAFFAKENS